MSPNRYAGQLATVCPPLDSSNLQFSHRWQHTIVSFDNSNSPRTAWMCPCSIKNRTTPLRDVNWNHVPLHSFSPTMPLLNMPPHAIQTSQFTFEQRSHRACVDQGERTLVPSSLAGGTHQRKQMQTDGMDVSAEVCW
jgi:hypothetical protein